MPARRFTALAAMILRSVPRYAADPQQAAGLVVMELFTPRSCSFCPPADALLARPCIAGRTA